MKIFIEPNDVLMFRDGRPFSAGDDHYARSVFPPPPSTFYGAIRSKILSERYPKYEKFKEEKEIPEDLRQEIGTPSSEGSLTIKCFLLGKRGNEIVKPIFPVPKDAVKRKGDPNGEIFILNPEVRLKEKLKFNFPVPFLIPLWLKDEKPLEEVKGFITLETLEQYLTGEGIDKNKIIELESLYKKDERIGIKKDRTKRTAATGALYTVEYIKLNINEDIGFLLELDGVKSLPEEGLLRLGGDHRSTFYRETSFPLPDEEKVKVKVKETGKFKVILLTPAFFNKGWIPDWIDEANAEGTINGITLQLISAAIGRPAYIGGFDLVKRKPKDMRKAVPSGSVYYFGIKQGDPEKVFDTFWFKSILKGKQKEQKEGFGISIIGGY